MIVFVIWKRRFKLFCTSQVFEDIQWHLNLIFAVSHCTYAKYGIKYLNEICHGEDRGDRYNKTSDKNSAADKRTTKDLAYLWNFNMKSSLWPPNILILIPKLRQLSLTSHSISCYLPLKIISDLIKIQFRRIRCFNGFSLFTQIIDFTLCYMLLCPCIYGLQQYGHLNFSIPLCFRFCSVLS